MTIMTIKRVSTAEAKAKLSELIGAVAYGRHKVVIERRGRPVAALVSLEDAERIATADTARRPGGALALLGAWADLEDAEIDEMVDDIYAARERDTGRPVEL